MFKINVRNEKCQVLVTSLPPSGFSTIPEVSLWSWPVFAAGNGLATLKSVVYNRNPLLYRLVYSTCLLKGTFYRTLLRCTMKVETPLFYKSFGGKGIKHPQNSQGTILCAAGILLNIEHRAITQGGKRCPWMLRSTGG